MLHIPFNSEVITIHASVLMLAQLKEICMHQNIALLVLSIPKCVSSVHVL